MTNQLARRLAAKVHNSEALKAGRKNHEKRVAWLRDALSRGKFHGRIEVRCCGESMGRVSEKDVRRLLHEVDAKATEADELRRELAILQQRRRLGEEALRQEISDLKAERGRLLAEIHMRWTRADIPPFWVVAEALRIRAETAGAEA